MPIRPRRIIAITAGAVTAAVLLAAAPAQAVTFDGEPVRTVARFTVAGERYTLRDVSYGSATRTEHVGSTSGKVPAHYRLTFRTGTGHVDADVRRGLEKATTILDRFTDATFPTRRAFLAAEHRALTMSARTARAHLLKDLRIESVESDLEATIASTADYLDGLPAGTRPDFDAVRIVRSREYRGSVTVSGDDRTAWTVVVRDTQDGFGEFFDAATGAEATFRF